MRLSTKLSGIVAIGGVAALGAGLISSGGIGAAFSDADTATVNASVGTMNCILDSSDTEHVKIHNSTKQHTATITLDKILASSGTQFVPLTVKNTGDMPVVTTWVTAGGYYDLKPTPAPSTAQLGVNGEQNVEVGFEWNDLGPQYMGVTTSATFTVTCNEVSAAALGISFDVKGTPGAASFDGTHIQINVPGGANGAAIFLDAIQNNHYPVPNAAPMWSTSNPETAVTRLNLRFSGLDGAASTSSDVAFGYDYNNTSTGYIQPNNWRVPTTWQSDFASTLGVTTTTWITSWDNIAAYANAKGLTIERAYIQVDGSAAGYTAQVNCWSYPGVIEIGTC